MEGSWRSLMSRIFNAPEFLKLYSPLQFDEDLVLVFADECERLGVRAWLKANRNQGALPVLLTRYTDLPKDRASYDSFLRGNDLASLKLRLAEERNSLSILNNT
jgi:hypothetical protein